MNKLVKWTVMVFLIHERMCCSAWCPRSAGSPSPQVPLSGPTQEEDVLSFPFGVWGFCTSLTTVHQRNFLLATTHLSAGYPAPRLPQKWHVTHILHKSVTDFLGPWNREEQCKAHACSCRSHGDAPACEHTPPFCARSWQRFLLQEAFENLAGWNERLFCSSGCWPSAEGHTGHGWECVSQCPAHPGDGQGGWILGAAQLQVRILSLQPRHALHQPAQHLLLMRALSLRRTGGTEVHVN